MLQVQVHSFMVFISHRTEELYQCNTCEASYIPLSVCARARARAFVCVCMCVFVCVNVCVAYALVACDYKQTPGRTQTLNFFNIGQVFRLVDLPGNPPPPPEYVSDLCTHEQHVLNSLAR